MPLFYCIKLLGLDFFKYSFRVLLLIFPIILQNHEALYLNIQLVHFLASKIRFEFINWRYFVQNEISAA